jgi:exodeoxyribonuclease VII large subunit
MELMKLLRTRQQRLHDLLMRKYHAHQQRLDNLARRRIFAYPLEKLRERERAVDDAEERLQRAAQLHLTKARHRLDALAGKLASLSPLNVLARGYSLTRTLPEKSVVRSIGQVKPGDAVEIVVSDGAIRAEVQSKSSEE